MKEITFYEDASYRYVFFDDLQVKIKLFDDYTLDPETGDVSFAYDCNETMMELQGVTDDDIEDAIAELLIKEWNDIKDSN